MYGKDPFTLKEGWINLDVADTAEEASKDYFRVLQTVHGTAIRMGVGFMINNEVTRMLEILMYKEID